MTQQKIKTVVETLRNEEGMSSEEILNEIGSFLPVSNVTLNAMQKAGMSAEEILEELTTEGKVAPSVCVEPKGTRTDTAFIKQYLRKVVGIPPSIKGYKYIVRAITVYKDGMAMTKELYPLIAKEYGTTTSKVERAIRHAIESVWNRNTDIAELFGYSVSGRKGKPTNSEFIATLVEILE